MTFDEWLKSKYTTPQINGSYLSKYDLRSAWEAGREDALGRVRTALATLSSGDAGELFDLIDNVE